MQVHSHIAIFGDRLTAKTFLNADGIINADEIQEKANVRNSPISEVD